MYADVRDREPARSDSGRESVVETEAAVVRGDWVPGRSISGTP